MRRPNIYSSRIIDRAAHLRVDEGWIAARLADPSSRVTLVWRSRNLVRVDGQPTPQLLPPEPDLLDDAGALALLGLIDDVAHFAIDLSHRTENEVSSLGQFEDLRRIGPLMRHEDGALMAYARGMMHWHLAHLYCGRCGHPTDSRDGGHVRYCSSPDCGAPAFPRTDPAVIMLVHSRDRVLLGRQAVWPPGMHSVLAGFVEPGESLEDAVAREVLEEVGIEVTEIEYHSSQPWPFPSSIMLGFAARAKSEDLRVNESELEFARWFHRDELLASPEDEILRLPSRDSISYRLISDWLARR